VPRTPGRGMSLWAQVGFYSSLGFILPGAAVGGVALGWFLDKSLHTSPVLTILLGVMGAAGGLIEILRILLRAEKRFDGSKSNNGSGTS
jgi:F0F1-type ATP synthase assembly protein I